MSPSNIRFSVFTKPWKTMPLPDLGEHVARLGFQGIELPVRPGFQVPPEKVGLGLPAAAKRLAEQGVRIESVAGTDRRGDDRGVRRSGRPDHL
jgi:sugar phosphate isomerase/epimerase